ncbi:hypothetical protein FIBSPDRAFT_931132 [Athelia psychrophila]|uniref:Major facilitator superfamily (MFS) profile domain-containing protein n=1 Tax=Athelia psychrophila TaxID=1759441 RepID=A0A166KWG0_9AGAM|nr:hypothetical protein FIBSPDRAFT_931132 [Fibularhizoctonia sp. CBS 109695]
MGGTAVSASSLGTPGYREFLHNTPWWRNSRLVALNACIGLVLLTSATSGYDGSMMNGLQSLSQWNKAFDHPTGSKVSPFVPEFLSPNSSSAQLGLLNAIQNIGSLVAFPFAPLVVDTFGRRPAISGGAIIMLVATALQTASWNVGIFIGARFLIGFGFTFASTASPLLITELAYPSHRAQATSMYNTFWYFGSIIAAWTTYGSFRVPSSWSWRIPSLLQGLPCALQLCLIFLVPESPRWLVSKGRETQALETLAHYHAKGDNQDPLVQYEFAEIKAALALEPAVANVTDMKGMWKDWASLFATPGNRRRMRIILALAVFSQWSGNGLVSYYLNKVFNAIGITDPDTQLLLNGILTIYNFFVAIAAGLLCDKYHHVVAGRAMIAMSCISDSMAYCPLVVSYTVEILPYALRAKGYAVFNFTISLSLIFNQYVNPIALDALGWKYYLVYVAWLAVESVFVFLFIIETKNKTLEETAALFDGANNLATISKHAEDRVKSQTSGCVDADTAQMDEKLSADSNGSAHQPSQLGLLTAYDRPSFKLSPPYGAYDAWPRPTASVPQY